MSVSIHALCDPGGLIMRYKMKYIVASILLLFVLHLAAVADTSVCVVGDTGTGTKKQYQVADAMERAGCDRIIVTGDVIYENGARSVEDPQWVEKFEKPYENLIANNATFYISLGNHDYNGGRKINAVEVYKAYSKKVPSFYFPERYYAFHVSDESSGSACFWALDTEKFDDGQLQAVEQSMQANSSCRWKLVFGHHPILSSGAHGNAKKALANKLQPLLEKHADIYFAGHDHHLSDEGEVSSFGKGSFRQIVSGAGAKLRPVFPCALKGCEFNKSTLGFVKATFSSDKVTLDFINEENKVIYQTTVQ